MDLEVHWVLIFVLRAQVCRRGLKHPHYDDIIHAPLMQIT